jgi:hypothetical protein
MKVEREQIVAALLPGAISTIPDIPAEKARLLWPDLVRNVFGQRGDTSRCSGSFFWL